MRNMSLPDWVQKYKTKGVEIRKRGKRYHAYRITSKWNPKKKRSQKITLEYLGVVTPSGITKPRKRGFLKGDYEYGHINFMWKLTKESGLLSAIKECYPYKWEEIISFAFLRLIQPLPLKSIHHLYDKTYLSKLFQNTAMSPKALSGLLLYLGENFTLRDRLMKKLTQKGKYIIIDLTALFSYSQNIALLEKSYNKDHLSLPQINLLLLFASDMKLPTYVRLLPGTVRDVSTIKNTIKMAKLENVFFIADRGFFSDDNVKDLRKEAISYVIPLKRNSTLIPKLLQNKFEGVFTYNDRPIIYWKKKKRSNFLYIFEDKDLKKDEETTFLIAVEDGRKNQEMYFNEQRKFGKLFLLSDVDDNPEVIYKLYKDREQIEYAFNVFKNLLEADKSYLQETAKFEGYIFLNLFSLYIYYLILNKLKYCDLNKKCSVKDLILQLSKVKVYDFEGEELLSEVPKQVRLLSEKLELDFDLLRIKWRS